MQPSTMNSERTTMDQPRKYRIARADEYFLVGQNADHDVQVLMGAQGTEIVCLFFTADGQFLRHETRNASESDTDDSIYAMMESWLQELEVTLGEILIDKFSIPDRSIEIRDLPEYLQEFVDDPSSFDEDRRQHLSNYIAEWEAGGDFVLIWDEEYEMNAQGELTST